MSDGKPFGQPACESEVVDLAAAYRDLYFDEIPFTDAALLSETYLIVGRRGSGKTALAQYFSFQTKLPDALSITVDRPDTYQKVLSDIATQASESRVVAIPQLRRVWEYVLWSLIVERLRDDPPAANVSQNHIGLTDRVASVFKRIVDGSIIGSLFQDSMRSDRQLDDRMRLLLADGELEVHKADILAKARRRPIIVTIDTLEQYNTNSIELMNALAALIECAAYFNLNYSKSGLHLKVFMSGEVLPYLQEEVLLNTSKCILDPVYLFWRPKDLLRLLCWRLYKYLEAHGQLVPQSRGIDWADHHQVLAKMWIPYFGHSVKNVQGVQERSFPYILRHTQMRPRQLIILCNAIAKQSIKAGRFPRFAESDIRQGVRGEEETLATEIVNSFSSLYPQVGGIVDALVRIDKIFPGNELNIRAKESASEWPYGTYSQAKFRRLVAELGIVGNVRRRNKGAGFIDADFEYNLRYRLPITQRDECVIHPMFYKRLAVIVNSPERVMPFSTERELETNEEDDDYFL